MLLLLFHVSGEAPPVEYETVSLADVSLAAATLDDVSLAAATLTNVTLEPD